MDWRATSGVSTICDTVHSLLDAFCVPITACDSDVYLLTLACNYIGVPSLSLARVPDLCN